MEISIEDFKKMAKALDDAGIPMTGRFWLYLDKDGNIVREEISDNRFYRNPGRKSPH